MTWMSRVVNLTLLTVEKPPPSFWDEFVGPSMASWQVHQQLLGTHVPPTWCLCGKGELVGFGDRERERSYVFWATSEEFVCVCVVRCRCTSKRTTERCFFVFFKSYRILFACPGNWSVTTVMSICSICLTYTPWTNSSPLKIGHPKIKLIIQPLIFKGDGC